MEKALKLLLMDRHELGNPKIVTTEMFNEAIKELEEAMKPKTCNECEWWNDFWEKCDDHDNSLAGVGNYCCNRFEPKDNA